MRFRILLGLSCLFSCAGALASAWPREGEQTVPDQPSAKAAPRMDFAKDVVPFLAKYCTTCHGGAKPKGGLDLARFTDLAAAGKHTQVWEKVVEQLRAGEMPPAGKPKPAPELVER